MNKKSLCRAKWAGMFSEHMKKRAMLYHTVAPLERAALSSVSGVPRNSLHYK